MLRQLTCISIALVAVACGNGETEAEIAESAQSGFLDPAAYADLVTLSPSFPFGVVARHAASGGVLNARWGAHGGPLVTLGNVVVRLPTTAEGRAESLPSAAPTGLPSPHFWSVDGMIDAPPSSDVFALRAYSTAGDTFGGEAIFYGRDYASVTGRAKVNGYYSGVFAGGGLVYSGLSGMAAEASATVDNGLWFATGCPSACRATKLFGWAGFSGPVVTDANGVVFVAAFRTGAPDAVFALTRLDHAALAPSTVAEQSTQGTSSLVAVSAPGATRGFIVAKGHDGESSAPSWGRAYRVRGDAVEGEGPIVADPVRAASDLVTTSFFADARGHLWVAAESDTGTFLLELAPKP